MGGKTQTSTSSVSVPPAVLQRYTDVNNLATQVGSTPFQQYSTDPNAFVAPINQEQQTGINQTNTFANAAQPYNAAATGYTLAGGQAVDPSQLNAASINQYLSPYLSTVLGSTSALLNQNNQQQQSGALGSAITSGAFGGDRAGIAAANLEQQQNLANANIYSGIANTGFNTALATAQQQQGLGLSAEQANRAALQQTGQSLAGLGQTAQAEGLQGAQAEQAAGATQQQTSQAGLTALYNQFLQQQSYPFQVAQFEANIAEGTGALSGSTTTTTQPQSIFSDERLKEDVQTIGKTFGGDNVVAFRYKGDPTRRIGLIAQDVEKRHPEAVHEVGGFKAVDYGKATEDSARKGHFYKGGLVNPANDNRDGYAGGGGIDPQEMMALEAASGTYGPYASGGLYGSQAGAAPRGGLSYVPSANLPVGHLAVAQPAAPPPSTLDQVKQLADLGGKGYDAVTSKQGQSALKSLGSFFQSPTQKMAAAASGPENDYLTADPDMIAPMKRGGFARLHRDIGGPTGTDVDPYGAGRDIPDEKPQNLSLAVAKPPGSGSGGGLGDLATLAMDGAKIASLFAKGGLVRNGYDNGGVVENDLAGLQDPADANAQQMLKSLLKPPAQPDEDDDGDGDQDAAEAPPGATDAGSAPAPGLGAPFMSPAAKGTPAPSQAAAGPSSLPTDLANTLKLVAKAEGTSKNPNSSARGPYQFIDPTFVGLFRQMFPERAQGMSKADILALRNTPEGDHLSAEMGPVYAHQNIAALQSKGVPASAPNVYLAHFLGPDGAIRVLSADPSTPMTQLVSPLAIAENKSIMKGKTAGDVIGWAGRRLQQVAGYASGGQVRKGYDDGGSATLDDNGDLTAAIPPIPGGNDAPAAPAPSPGGPDLAGDAAVSNAGSVQLGNQTAQPLVHDPAAAPPPKKSSWQESLRKPEVFIPLLTGLAAAAATPTVHPLMAIAEGLGAAGQSYQQQRAFGLEQQKTAQHQQEVNILGAGQALQPQQIAATQAEAAARVMQAKAGLVSNALATFNTLYHPSGKVGPDGKPMYIDTAGNTISSDQYAKAKYDYVNQVLGYAGGSQLGGGGTSPPNPVGDQNVPGPSGGPVPASVAGGAQPPAGGGVPAGGGGGAGPAVPPAGGGAVGPAVGGAGGRQAPTGGAALPPHATLAQRVSAGQFRNSPISVTPPSDAGLLQGDDPAYLEQQGNALIANGQTDLGQQQIAKAKAITAGTVIPLDTSGKPDNRYVVYQQQLGQQNAAQQHNAAMYSAKEEAAANFAASAPQAYQVQNALNRVYATGNTNRMTPEMADLIGKASSIPWLRSAISPALQQYQSTNDEAIKETALQTMVQAAATGLGQGAPASTLAQASHTVPLPTMAPGARYDLAAQQLALLRMRQDYTKAWNTYKGQVGGDIAGFDNAWLAEHPVGGYEAWAYDHIMPFAGMTDQEKMAHPRRVQSPDDVARLPPHTPFRIPSGPNAGKIAWSS